MESLSQKDEMSRTGGMRESESAGRILGETAFKGGAAAQTTTL
jgi:hypothetical protein